MKPVQLRGAMGLTTTELKPEGMVLINGEMWTARSFTGTTIPANKPIEVIAFEGHLILVKE